MATYNSSSISRGDPARGPNVTGVTVVGCISVGNVTLTSGDLLPICLIPANSYIKNLAINFPILNPSGTTLAISLLDTLASPTTYISASTKGTNFSAATSFAMSDMIAAVTGTQYASTARSVGSTGSAVVVWAAGVQLQLKVTATASAATGGTVNILYVVEFAPTYDAGT